MTKKEPLLYIFRKLILKDEKTNNHCAGHSVMKPVDAEQFQRRKDIKEGGNKKNDDFDMDILREGALEKALNAEKNTPDGKQPQKNIYEVIDFF